MRSSSCPLKIYTAASLLERLPELKKWSVTLPAIVAPQGLPQTTPTPRVKMTEEIKSSPCAKRSGCQATSVGWFLMREVRLRQKLRSSNTVKVAREMEMSIVKLTVYYSKFISHLLFLKTNIQDRDYYPLSNLEIKWIYSGQQYCKLQTRDS